MHPIFKDREEEAAGHSIGSAIEAAMGSSEFLIVVCSPRSAQSQWVNREVAWFKTHRDPTKILAIIIDGEPMASLIPGREAEECFPKTLLYKVGADLQLTDETEDAPLAADARETGDGKRGAKLKLAAAMLGVGYDALHRRDDRRRAERRRIVMGAMAASMALLGGLTLYAFNQRDAAIAARNEAVVARNDARFQRDEAQSLVEFMLTDLRQRLDAVGRLDILDTVAERLNESYAKQDLTKLDADALGRRARVQLLLGEVDNTRGNLDAALAQYKEAAAATEELLRRDPDNEQRIFDHAQSVYWVGDIALRRGDMAAVTDYWTQYRDFGARLVDLDPDKDEWKTELAYGRRNLASLAFDRGDMEAATIGFRLASEISGALAAAAPLDRARQINFGDDLQWLALAQERSGKFEESSASLSAEDAIYATILAADPADDAVLRQRAVNNRIQARLAAARGDIDEGLALLDGLFPLHESQLSQDPQNTKWINIYGMLQLEAGRLRLASGDIESARLLAAAAINTAERLISIDQSAVDWRIDIYCGARLLAARADIAAGEHDRARRLLEEASLAVEEYSTAREQHIIDQFRIWIDLLRYRLAQSSRSLDVERRNLADRTRAIEALLPKSGFESKTVFVEALLLAGKPDEARRLASDLEAAGYRHPDFINLKTQLAGLDRTEEAHKKN